MLNLKLQKEKGSIIFTDKDIDKGIKVLTLTPSATQGNIITEIDLTNVDVQKLVNHLNLYLLKAGE